MLIKKQVDHLSLNKKKCKFPFAMVKCMLLHSFINGKHLSFIYYYMHVESTLLIHLKSI